MSDPQFVKLTTTHEMKGVRYKRFKILARNVAVFNDGNGGFYAIEYSCKHQNWDLTTGPIVGDIVTCPRHGWKYNVRTGLCLTHDSTCLRPYGVKVEGEDIYVTLLPVSG
ncbi:MAG: hypothetical protein AMXMBFR84_49060 [Candidatus Hydrogenedentota bacterium]